MRGVRTSPQTAGHAPAQQVTKVLLNQVDPKVAPNNRISTCKYKWWSFLFVFLLEQYQKVFNVFILAICICNSFKFANVVSNSTLVMPIVFVLFVAALREIVEDVGRYKADQFTNNQSFEVIRNANKQWMKSADICQGDLLLLRDGQEIPCDVALLYSSESSRQAFVNTASLDGESNLKPKSQIVPFHEEVLKRDEFEAFATTIQGSLGVGPPSNNMSEFNGKILLNVNFTAEVGQQLNFDRADVGSDLDVPRSRSFNSKKHRITQRFSLDNVMLKGMKMQNTEFALCSVIYTGADTRLMKSVAKTKSKNSRIESRLNKILLMMVVAVLVLMLLFTLLSVLAQDYDFLRSQIWFSKESPSKKVIAATRAVQYVIICSYFLPISLIVSLELTRFFQTMQVDADKHLRRDDVKEYIEQKGTNCIASSPFANMAPCQLAAKVNNSVTVENLAEVDIVFSDKTGTLTKNEMKFAKLVTSDSRVETKMDKMQLFAVALCNTVIPKQDGGDGQIQYQGESPDEIAFAIEARNQKLALVQRHATMVFYDYKINEQQAIRLAFEVLAVVPFSSARKRMSIVLREKGVALPNSSQQFFGAPVELGRNGKPFVLTKGADNVMLPRCEGHDPEQTAAIDKLSEQGLRTLVFGFKHLEERNVDQFVRNWERVRQLPEDSDEYGELTEQLEQGLRFALTTAIEDKLQDEVQDTLQSLRKTGIKIWMLTGDKTLTAISIAKSTGLSRSSNAQLLFTADALKNKMQSSMSSKIDAMNIMLYEAMTTQMLMLSEQDRILYNKQLHKKQKKTEQQLPNNRPHANIRGTQDQKLFNLPCTVVLDAEFFRDLLKHQQHYKLFQIAFSSKAVVCCRLSPLEKAVIVSFCHHYHPSMTTLSIGDGANDTAMIKMAQVGVGVAGKEGLHACNNSDVSIPEFKFLKRMLFVHGRLNHMRNSELIDYSIYKNCQLVFVNLMFQFFCRFSGMIATESFLLMMFNMLITFICIFVYSLNEKDVYPAVLLKYPQQLMDFRKRYQPNLASIMKSIIFALYNAFVLMFVTKAYFGHGVLGEQGLQSDLYLFQSIIMMVAIFVSICKVLVSQRIWNVFSAIGLCVSLLISFGTQVVGASFTGFGIGQLGIVRTIYSGVGYTLIIAIEAVLCLIPILIDYFFIGFANPDVGFELMSREHKNGCFRESTVVRV